MSDTVIENLKDELTELLSQAIPYCAYYVKNDPFYENHVARCILSCG